MQRSGWDPGARFLIFDCGPLGDGGHGHYDLLSVEAHGGGRPLVVDPGRGSYSEAPPNLRRWFRGHGGAQHGLRRRARPDALQPRPPARAGRARAPPRPRLRARARPARRRGAVSPVYEAVHERRIAFVADRYWLVEDRLRGRARAPLRPALAPRAGRARRHARGRRHGARARPGARRSSARSRSRSSPAGWRRATACGSTRRSSARPRTATSARFVTLLAPGRAGAAAGARRGRAPAGRDRRRARHDRPARDAAASGSARACGWAWSSHDRAARARPGRAAARRAARRAADGGAAGRGPDRRRGRRLRAREREVPRRRQPARRLPDRGRRRVAHRRGAHVRGPQRERLSPRRRGRRRRAAARGAPRARARDRVLDVPQRPPALRAARCSTAAPARSTGSSGTPSPARG